MKARWILAIVGTVMLAGLAVPFALLVRSLPVFEPAPASGRCSSCDGRLIRVHWGKGGTWRGSEPRTRTLPRGWTFTELRLPKGDLEGGCVVGPACPAWICEQCGKTWIREALLERERPSLYERCTDRIRLYRERPRPSESDGGPR